MVVAQLEAYFSRPVAPTRRIAVGALTLPRRGATAAASMLLGGLIAAHVRHLDPDDMRDLRRLIGDVEMARRVPQPRLRHRFQTDRVGLRPSSTTLARDGSGVFALELDDTNGTSAQHALAAVYASRDLRADQRRTVADGMRLALDWGGPPDADLLALLGAGPLGQGLGRISADGDPVVWALAVLGLESPDGRPGRPEVQRAFRSALRVAHPDHGGSLDSAAVRIEELDAARRILLR